MAVLGVRSFAGMAPRMAPRLLAENKAQSAQNVRLLSGNLEAMGANVPVAGVTLAPLAQTIHHFDAATQSATNYWFSWSGDVDVVKGPIANDLQERTYWTGDGVPKVTDASIALSGAGKYPRNSYSLGVPAPATAPIVTVSGTPSTTSAIAETRLYLVTYVSAWGEESAPSDPSLSVDVLVGQSVDMSAIPTAPTGAYNVLTKRIYRSVTGTNGTPYLFVAEIPVAQSTYSDTIEAAALGEELPSLTYDMPPATLQGLVAMPGGVLAGFVGYDLYFCEPYKPHAWPAQYSMTCDHKIIGLAVFDSTLLVLTDGTPYLVSGSEPAYYSMVKSELAQSCVSKRSIVSGDGGAVFASPDGLFLIGGGGAKSLTTALLTRLEWQALNPETLHGYIVENQYIGFHSGGGFILALETGDLTTLDWTASAGFYDTRLDTLFLIVNGGLVKFDQGAAIPFVWKSKRFYSPRPLSMSAARVEAASYPLTMLTYADGVLVDTATVASAEAFHLPGGFLANDWEFELRGSVDGYSAMLAQSMRELANA
jgi:hypothetical protein